MLLGPVLAEAASHKGKILLRAGIRLVLAGVVILAGIRGNPPSGRPVNLWAALFVAVMALAATLWVFFPLTHWRDQLTFYQNGMAYNKRSWTLEELGEISFYDQSSNRTLFTRTYMRTAKGSFDVTYIKDGKKNYNQAYMNFI